MPAVLATSRRLRLPNPRPHSIRWRAASIRARRVVCFCSARGSIGRRALWTRTATHSSKSALPASNFKRVKGVAVYTKSKPDRVIGLFSRASTGLALCLMQFLQTVSTAFSYGTCVGAFVGLLSTAFNQTFLFQAITATFGNSVAFHQAISATFNQAFLFQTIAAVFYNAFGVSAFVGVVRTVFSDAAVVV